MIVTGPWIAGGPKFLGGVGWVQQVATASAGNVGEGCKYPGGKESVGGRSADDQV